MPGSIDTDGDFESRSTVLVLKAGCMHITLTSPSLWAALSNSSVHDRAVCYSMGH